MAATIFDRYAVHVCSTRPQNTIIDDIVQIGRSRARGIGVWEGKFAGASHAEVKSRMDHYGLTATNCLPLIWTILPLPASAKPELRGGLEQDPAVRTRQICESIPRLAVFEPELIIVGPGVSGDPARPAGPISAVQEGLHEIAEVAAEHGLRVGFELLAARRGCPILDLPEMVSFIDRFGLENVGVMWDMFHSWSEPDVHENLRRYGDRIIGVQVTDVRVNERSHRDRVFPGQGRGVAPELLATLLEIGYEGWFELEVFSDDGTFGNNFPDSLWKLEPDDYLRRAEEAYAETYEAARKILSRRSAAARPENA
ncbi:sugar phosphate isomerase/epimerase family protein [Pseudonocardia sp.]|jgi:sugar phosphate isomerase/epimerase|uniref:sugar phosphate isomerase/epimerase family protein n=1 Tax=Pseudonocardia sp. TaxID=60912 RepID=UPI0031FBDF6A